MKMLHFKIVQNDVRIVGFVRVVFFDWFVVVVRVVAPSLDHFLCAS